MNEHKEAMTLALEALKENHYYMIDAGLPNQSMLNKTFTAYKALKEALAKQEQPLPPVEIGVDVTSDGASVVAFYRRPNAVMEMFYSQFHPQPKQEQGEPVAYLVTGPYEKQPFANIGAAASYCKGLNKGFGEDAYTVNSLYTTPYVPEGRQPAQKPWVGLTPQERDKIQEQVYGAVPHHVAFHHAIEAKLKEKNT